MKLVPHLTFDGNCKEAFEFYRDLLHGTLAITTFGESPAAGHVSSDLKDKVVHATLTFNDSELAGADVPANEYKKAEGMYLLLEPEDAKEAERIFEALSEQGIVVIPLQEMFWSVAYGSLVDKFGTPWEISCMATPSED
ncbi:MAG: VOC family protein [Pseudomonadales bacterium]|nr:VOC family protein [Pseudomonadales bacterium]